MNLRPGIPARNAALTLAILAGVSFLLPECPVWITDNGNKYIVMRNHALYGTTALRHPAPEFFPTGGFHFIRHRGDIRSFYPEYYPVFVSVFFRWFGDRAASWLSMLGTCAAVWMLSRLTSRLPRGAPLLLVVATPMLFFSFLLWEMTWNVFFVLCALVLSEKKRFFCTLCKKWEGNIRNPCAVKSQSGIIGRSSLYYSV